MTLHLTSEERAVAGGSSGDGHAVAMRIVAETAEIMGADRLVPIASAHIDGCLYHGDGGVEFAEMLVAGGGQVQVPSTLNVGALDLLNPTRIRADAHRRKMAWRLMSACEQLGCRPTWTCAPYQAGHRPSLGEHVAWGESNAVAFANSVLGARTNRCGDFLDLCCALSARAPLTGLHLDENRRATVHVRTDGISARLKNADEFYPVLGSWLGTDVGDEVPVIGGLIGATNEDRLKALGAAAASSGSVGLFHIAGVTPEAHDLATALGGRPAVRTVDLTPEMIRIARDQLSTTDNEKVSVVALGSPHFSVDEFHRLDRLLGENRTKLPLYVCTGRGVVEQIEADGLFDSVTQRGVEIVTDTCIVVTPILPPGGGVLMTNSGKFARYTPPNTGYDVIYGSLEDCVATACNGELLRDETMWS